MASPVLEPSCLRQCILAMRRACSQRAFPIRAASSHPGAVGGASPECVVFVVCVASVAFACLPAGDVAPPAGSLSKR